MADALVGATIQVLLEKSISFATERIGLIIGFKEELQSLRESVEMILVVLADAEDKQRHNQAVQLWLKKLEGVAFDADNVLDQINYEVLRRKVESLNQLKGKVCFFFSFSNTKIAFRWRMASKVREINMKLKKINQEANEFGLIQMAVSLPAATTGMTSSRETDSIVAQNVVGRENDELKIVEMLLSPSEEVVSVIPITGMGGLGKTTLAKSVYNNPKIDEHFKTKIWVCVSDISEVKKLFKLILESLWGGRNIEMTGRDAIVKEIQKQLGEKRYLIVLDDVWNQEPGLWDDFFRSLVGLNSTIGSKCLVTTRLKQVASIVSRHDPYLLGRLSDDDCWSIIKENTIAGGVVPIELNNMKEQVIKRCDGLPLAANAIGGLLRLQRREEWRSIVEKNLLNLTGGEHGVGQILKVSFGYLPSAAVKKCFAYCSIFAKDSLIERDELIELWMAEGFLQSNVENEREMEKIGIKYCEILLQSSLLEKASDTYYKMHDLVHDLAQSISRSERVNLENGTITNSYPVRYLALESHGETKKISKDISLSLRTLFIECSISGDILVFKNLHVLNWSGAGLKELPTTIGKLIHLRSLNLSGCKIVTLPESLCKLYNLQTLRFGDEERFGYEKDYGTLTSLPEQMRNLISLRHLHYKTENAQFQMPLNMGRLTRLQTLKFFNIGLEKGRRFEELRCLGDLSGSLEIRNLELVNGKEGAKGANLFGKPNLSELKFQWSWHSECDNYDDENVLEGLQPHPNLKKLQIKNYMGDYFPQWFMNLSSTTLSNLVELSLIKCKRCKEIPALGQLPFLQNLLFLELETVTCIEPLFYAANGIVPSKLFPALKELRLLGMENLMEWKEAELLRSITDDEVVVDVFPMLERLIIINCSQFNTAPSHFPSLKDLIIRGNYHVLVVSKILSKVTTLEYLDISGMTGLTCGSDLGGLQLNNQSLKYLKLEKYPNLTSIRGCGTSLQHLNIINCENLKELPEDLCKFQSLQYLDITRCPSIVKFPEGEYNLTSLHSVTISYCNGLTSLPDHMLESCTSLYSLTISDCNGLTSLPGHMLKSCTSLYSLKISGCNGLTSLPGHMLKSCTSLYSLQISGCNGLTSLPGHMVESCTSLHSVTISECNGLTSLPGHMLESCTSCEGLDMYDCPNLVSFPLDFQKMPSFYYFVIKQCPKLMISDMPKGFGSLTRIRELNIGFLWSDDSSIDFDWSGLISLSPSYFGLTLYGMPQLESLPDQLQHLTTLTSLEINDFGGVEALPDWIGNLVNLEYLDVLNCAKLRYLPSAAAVRRLTKLYILSITNCPLLKERCSPQSGPDSEWSKISHIPYCWIL